MPEIAVIVPIFNAEKLLIRCVDSILAQTYSNFELILVDDGSTDQSGKICDLYAERHSQIRVIHQQNRGQAAARNRGVALAKAEWIAFVDADDVIHPQYLELLYHAVQEWNVKMSICHIHEASDIPEWFYSAQKYEASCYLLDQNAMKQWMRGECTSVSRYAYWVVWGKLIHNSVLEKHPFTENRIYEDNAIVCQWLYEAKQVAFCDNSMYFYYVNQNGTTKKKYTLKRLDWLWAVQEQIRFYCKIGYSEMALLMKKRYVWEALREYRNVKSLLDDKQAANRLRRHIWGYVIWNQPSVRLSYSEIMEVCTTLNPRLINKLSAFRGRKEG